MRAGVKVHLTAGKSPPNSYFEMSGIEVFIDESGDFGPYQEHCQYYFVTMVFHDSAKPLYAKIFDLEYRLAVLGLENHCLHSSPAIRGEDEYYGVDLVVRRKAVSSLMAFIQNAGFRYKCFSAKKAIGKSGIDLLSELREQINSFVTANYNKLASYSCITVAYDRGQKQISQLISDTLETRFQNVRVTKILPIHSRLSQVADLVCTIRRIESRLIESGTLARSESFFFGGIKNFKKNWLKSIKKSEWL